MEPPVTEPIDLDFKTPKVQKKRRSSFFNYENTPDYEQNLKTRAYVEKLNLETKDWVKMIQETNARLKQLSKFPKPIYDASILSKERLDYLNQAINIPEYLRKLQESSTQILFYIKQKEWAQKRIQYCEQKLDDDITEIVIKNLSTRAHDIVRNTPES